MMFAEKNSKLDVTGLRVGVVYGGEEGIKPLSRVAEIRGQQNLIADMYTAMVAEMKEIRIPFKA